jgi:hypothetical protein
VSLGYARPPGFDESTAAWSGWLLLWADRYRKWVMLAILAIYLAGFNAQWRLEPDSALYLSIGQNLANGHGYTFQGRPNRLAYPGLPVLFAGIFKSTSTFGHGRSLVPELVIMLLMGMATLGLTYRLFLLSSGRPTAVIITTGVAMSRVFYRYNFELLSDLPFLLGVMSFLVGYEAIFHRRGVDPGGTAAVTRRRVHWFDGLLLVAGLAVAIAMRPAMWALVFAVIAASVWSLLRAGKRSLRWGQLLICLAVIGAVAVFYIRDPRHAAQHPGQPAGPVYAEEDEMLNLRGDKLLAMVRRGQGHVPMLVDAVTKAAFGMQLPWGSEWVLGTTMALLGMGLLFYRPLWGMLVATTVLMVLLVKPLDRYFLPVAPLLVFAWWRFCVWVNRSLPARWGNKVFAILFVLGACTNGAKVFAFMFEQRSTPFLSTYKEGRYASTAEAARMIEAHTPPSGPADSPQTTWVLVGPKMARIITFLSSRYAIEPEERRNLDPDHQPLFALEPSASPDSPTHDQREQPDIHPGVRKWMADRNLQLAPTPIATVPNKDPQIKGVCSLYAVVHAKPAPQTRP